jgi:glycerophosphoryl diester phosphodiesterase
MLHIAHRGASASEPENTLRAIRAALGLKVDGIEIDVHNVGGHLVVIHDLHVDRTTDGRGPLLDFTFERLRQLDAGKGERIPTLEEVADVIGRRVPLIIELKGPGTGGLAARCIQERVRTGRGLYRDFMLSSFDQYELQEAMNADAEVPRAVLFQGVPLGLAAFAEALRPVSLHLSREFVRRGIVADAKRRGYDVYVYTVDDADEMRWLEAQGVDGVFTNCPAWLAIRG